MDIPQLYQVLLQEIKNNPTKYQINKKICFNINKLEDSPYPEVLNGLIYHHYIVENKPNQIITELDLVKRVNKKSNILSIPYGGKTYDNGKGPHYENLSKMTPTMKQIITAYIMHIGE
jgi:hypothetical protein